jgi:hypothetical protein
MSVDSCVAFFDLLSGSPELGGELRAMSDPREIVALGRRCGYAFDEVALFAAMSEVGEKVGELFAATTSPSSGRASTWHHHEFEMEEIPALSTVIETLEALKIQPSTVDLDAFARSFRAEDLAWTDMNPTAAPFQGRYQEIMSAPWDKARPEYLRRDFHLVNLDRHVDHPLYDAYFQARSAWWPPSTSSSEPECGFLEACGTRRRLIGYGTPTRLNPAGGCISLTLTQVMMGRREVRSSVI